MSGLQGHTPGPWSVGQRLTNGSLPIYRNGDPRMEVAKVNGHAGEMEANAALIASAPDMRAALAAKDARIAELEGENERLRYGIMRLLASVDEYGALGEPQNYESARSAIREARSALTPSPKARETEGEVRK